MEIFRKKIQKIRKNSKKRCFFRNCSKWPRFCPDKNWWAKTGLKELFFHHLPQKIVHNPFMARTLRGRYLEKYVVFGQNRQFFQKVPKVPKFCPGKVWWPKTGLNGLFFGHWPQKFVHKPFMNPTLRGRYLEKYVIFGENRRLQFY